MTQGKVIIISAPSGCGKSTIINHILDKGEIDMQFSVSATNRPPRPGEVDGKSYHFLTTEEFLDKIAAGEFVEYEQVYPGRYYGTLRSEISRITMQGHNVILDIDVKGGVNVKRLFGREAVSIFIQPPSVEALRSRLEGRGTDDAAQIAQRIGRAEEELGYAPQFDCIVVNDILDNAVAQVERIIMTFVNGGC